MKSLIVEDDFTSRLLLQELLRSRGQVDVASNGKEALDAFSLALKVAAPYDLVCMDIMMPEMDGQQALTELRRLEAQHGQVPGRGSKVIMITALHDKDSVMRAFREQCDGYLVKPVDGAKLAQELRALNLA